MFIKNDPYKQLNNDISELKSVELELKHRIDELNTQLRDTTEERNHQSPMCGNSRAVPKRWS